MCPLKVVLFVCVVFSEGRKFIGKYSQNITNPLNWVEGKYSQNCEGIIFAEDNTAVSFVEDVSTSLLVLPRNGEIELRGKIEFIENDKKCIKLKPIDAYDRSDPASWILEDKPNVALPDKLKVPCDFDSWMTPDMSKPRVIDDDCTNINICPCRPMATLNCPLKEIKAETIKCHNPIVPKDFCHEICGAYITFQHSDDLQIETLLKKLQKYPVDTFIGPSSDLSDNLMQAVFSEKEFSGQSLSYADDFFKYLSSLKFKDLKLVKSGGYHVENKSTVSIIFGTLFGVVAFFGILFYWHQKPSFSKLLTRFNRRKGSMFNMPFFARFDNTDENLIIEGQSEAGSILDIPKSFDNPMFDQVATVSAHHENPLYEATKED